MYKLIALILAAYQIEDLGHAYLKLDKNVKNGKDKLKKDKVYFPREVHLALLTLWGITDVKSLIATGHFKNEHFYIAEFRGNRAKKIIFRETVKYFKELSVLVKDWQANNEYSDSDITDFMNTKEFNEYLERIAKYVKDNEWKG